MSTRLLLQRVVVCCAIGVSILSLGSTWAEEPAADAPASPTFLFLGDSITRGGGYVRLIGEELSRRHPDSPPKLVNQGRSSETVSDLSEAYHPGRRPCLFARLDAELAANKPDWVVACYGINDGIYHPFNEERFAAYQAGIESLIKKAHDSGARVLLLTPPPFARMGPFPDGADAAAKQEIVAKANAAAEIEAEKDPNKFGYRTPYAYYDDVMAQYAEWLLTLDDRDNVWVVDVRTPMLAKLAETHGGDPIHPNATGHAIMAEAFLKRWPAIEGAIKE